MYSYPRGKALIINVQTVAGHEARQGTDIDRDGLVDMCKDLYLTPTVYNDADGLRAVVSPIQYLLDLQTGKINNIYTDPTPLC